MAEFIFKGKKMYYEDHGEGFPLLMVNGIFMSCSSWDAFVPTLSKNNRLLMLDLVDQGRSEKVDYEYTHDLQIELIKEFLDYLKIEKVNIFSISYGGEVSMKFAARYPEMVNRLILANTAPRTNPWLLDMGKAWEYAMESCDGHQFFKTCIPVVYSPEFYTKNADWAHKREEVFVKNFTPEDYAAFGRLIRSSETHDAREELCKITAPTLIISSEWDFITPLPDQDYLVRNIKTVLGHIMLKNVGHASMYEYPEQLAAIILGFLATDIGIKIL